MKRFTALLLSMTLFLSTLSISVFNINPVTVQADETWPSQPDTFATAACLIEASTGTVLYQKKPHKKMYPASITKILTALVTLDNADLNEEVTFSSNAIGSIEYGDAHLEMQVGEKMSVQDCLYGLMLKSANEVAYALAEHVGGSVENFAEMMNQRAKEAGATDSNFVNPSGLHDSNHYITAYDMAMITRAAVNNPIFVSISGSYSYSVNSNKKKDYPVYNRHKMLSEYSGYYYDGILGGKTGFTDQSGTTLVSYAERNGMTLVCVVLNSNGVNSYNDTKLLFDYGFENFNLVNVSENDTRFTKDCTNYTDMLTPVFGTDNDAELSIDSNAAIVLPKDADFKKVSSKVTFDALNNTNTNENIVASIQYTYLKHTVGSASILYTTNENKTTSVTSPSPDVEETYSDSETVTNDTKNKQPKIKISKSLLKKIFVVIIIAVVFIVILLLIRRKQKQLEEIRARKRRRT